MPCKIEGNKIVCYTKPAKCKQCGAEIRFIRMLQSGKLMPCDIDPIPITVSKDGMDKLVVIYGEFGSIEKVVYDGESKQQGYVPHFATCPVRNKI